MDSLITYEEIFIEVFEVKLRGSFTLVSSDKKKVVFTKRSLKKCVFFENFFNNDLRATRYITKSTNEPIFAIKNYVKNRDIPRPKNAYPFIQLGLEIEFDKVVNICARNATGFAIPEEASLEDVCDVIEAFVRALPTRYCYVYEPLYKDIYEWQGETCRTNDRLEVISTLANVLSKKLDDSLYLRVFPLYEKGLTVALMQKIPAGPNEVVAYLDNSWTEVEMFGKHFKFLHCEYP